MGKLKRRQSLTLLSLRAGRTQGRNGLDQGGSFTNSQRDSVNDGNRDC